MDLRVWQWRSPWEKRSYLFYFLCYLCLLLRQHVAAVETGYSQESKNDVSDSNKLDSLSGYLPYDSREDSDYKRGSAFFPLRGKKPSDNPVGGHQLFIPDLEDSEDKRSQFFPLRGKKVPDDLKRASYFMPMRGRKDEGWIEEDYDITDESPNKRASSFMPMRGKKKYAAISDYLTKAGTYFNDVSEVLNPTSSDSFQTSDKRMPVRGKRSYKESESTNLQASLTKDSHDVVVSNHSATKRSVSFMPMRGRREFENSDAEASGDIATSLLEKKMHSFMPMRGRRDDDDDDDDSQNFDKKATFMPMRGKKYSDYQNLENFQIKPESKRAQSFMPMRGRRTHLRDVVYEASNIPETESRLIEDKRASSFMPMRGRRSLSEDAIASESDLNKRASSFTPMRGRRSTDYVENELTSEDPQSVKKRVDFMPMRGRRSLERDFEVEPWSADQLTSRLNKKSSSFMPMRGRRFDYENITVDPWPATELMSLFNKRSSSFMPMRGRRFDYENITVDPWPATQLMSLFNKRSSAFMPMRGRRFDYENITVDPWPATQLMSLFNKRSSFMPMRGRRWDSTNEDSNDAEFSDNEEKRSSYFMPMRGRRFDNGDARFYNPYPYLMAGIGSSLMSKPYSDQGVSFHSVRSANERRKKLRINWDAVKRAFHATRGKRFHEVDDFIHSLKDSYTSGPFSGDEMEADSMDDSKKLTRTKRSFILPRVAMQPNRQYIALKRPMSFFATRGKRLDDSAIDKLSKLR